MTSFKSQHRRLQDTADELLADESFASLVALFNDQPLPPWRDRTSGGRPYSHRQHGDQLLHRPLGRLANHGLLALTLLVASAVPAAMIATLVTGIPVFMVGTVLMVPAFLMFAQGYHRGYHLRATTGHTVTDRPRRAHRRPARGRSRSPRR